MEWEKRNGYRFGENGRWAGLADLCTLEWLWPWRALLRVLQGVFLEERAGSRPVGTRSYKAGLDSAVMYAPTAQASGC
jgi:hypothetical protein